MKYVDRLARLVVRFEDSPNGGIVVHNNCESSLVVDVKFKQQHDPILIELKESVLGNLNELFLQGEDGVLRCQRRLCVPNVDYLRNQILEKAHGSRY